VQPGRRRLLITVLAVAVAVVLGFLLWPRGKESGIAARPTTGSGGATPAIATRGIKDSATGAPRWIGAPGVAGRRVAGVVVGEDGAPIAGATVRLTSRWSAAGLLAAGKQQTDANGRFDFGVQPTTQFIVSADKPTLTATPTRVNVADAGANPASDHLRLVMHPCTASIHGTIYDTVGGTIPHATVARTVWGADSGVAAEADDAGAYELCVDAGGDEVKITADGYAPEQEDVQVYGRTRRDFQLVPGTPVTGRVVRAGDNSPVAGAFVELRSSRGRGDVQLASSADDGTFHFAAVAPGRHQIEAQAERLASEEPAEITVEVGAPVSDVVVAVSATYSVSGRLITRGTKEGVVGHGVFLVAETNDGMRRFQNSGTWKTTGDDGAFTFDSVRPGHYTAVPTGDYTTDVDYTGKVDVKDKDITGVIVETDVTGSIAGRVTLDGKPVDGAEVRANGVKPGSNGTTRSDGTFELLYLAPGEYEVYAQSNRVGAFTKGPKVALKVGERKTGVEVELDLAGAISGVVVDQNDKPVPGVFLQFSLLKGRDFGSATTADDGSFTASALSGGGDYIYEVKQSERSSLSYPPIVGKRFPPVAVADGKTHITGLRIKVKYERLTISGRVVDSAGKPVTDARVSAAPQGDLGWWTAPAASMSDQNGAFALRDLTSGQYSLEAKTIRGTAELENIAAGATGGGLKPRASGGAEGTHGGAREAPEVTAFSYDDYEGVRGTITGSTFQFRNLPPGRYRITARTKNDVDSVSIEVEPEKIATVKLTLRAKGTITGTIVDAKTKAPVADLMCMAAPARKEDMDIGGGARATAPSDASGSFTIKNARAGENRVACWGDELNAWGTVTVTAGQSASVQLTSTQSDPGGREIGMELDNQLSEVVVETVAPGGPAAAAGIVVGDVISSVDGRKVGRYQADMIEKQLEYDEKNDHTIVLERSDKEVTVTLKLGPPAQSQN